MQKNEKTRKSNIKNQKQKTTKKNRKQKFKKRNWDPNFGFNKNFLLVIFACFPSSTKRSV